MVYSPNSEVPAKPGKTGIFFFIPYPLPTEIDIQRLRSGNLH